MTSHKSSMEECFSTSSILIPFTCSSFGSSSAIAPVVRQLSAPTRSNERGKVLSKKWLAHIHSFIFRLLRLKRHSCKDKEHVRHRHTSRCAFENDTRCERASGKSNVANELFVGTAVHLPAKRAALEARWTPLPGLGEGRAKWRRLARRGRRRRRLRLPRPPPSRAWDAKTRTPARTSTSPTARSSRRWASSPPWARSCSSPSARFGTRRRSSSAGGA